MTDLPQHKNVFENIASGDFPVKMNGKVVGTGKLNADGSVEMDIFDEEAKAVLYGDTVQHLSIDNNSHTITAIMKNKKRMGS